MLDGDQHVIPLFGREHEASRKCWCKPRIETVLTSGTIWTHEPSDDTDDRVPGVAPTDHAS